MKSNEKLEFDGNNRVPVVFITDENFAIPTCVAIISLIENKDKDTFYDIFIFVDRVSIETENKLFSLKKDDVNIQLIHVSSEKYEGIHEQGEKSICVASLSALFKFEIPNILPLEDKILYLDGDILVRKDLKELFNINIENFYVAAAHDTGKLYFKRPIIKKIPSYFNSGVMLLNLKRLRENKIPELLVETKKRQKTNLMDQDVFNIVLQGGVKHIDIKYNFLILNLHRAKDKYKFEQINALFNSSYKDLEDVEEKSHIIHFSSRDKPWKSVDGVYSKQWFSYFRMSPFRDSSNTSDIKLAINEYSQEYPDVRKFNTNPIVHRAPNEKKEGIFQNHHAELNTPQNKIKKLKFDKLLSFLYILKKENLNPKNIYRILVARGLINSSNLFDERYYLSKHHDVKSSSMNPLDHYIYHGWKEKRVPSLKFDGNYYLRRYPDVKRAKMNPLVHYVLHGKKEGRFPNHQAEDRNRQHLTKEIENLNKNLENKINQQNREINNLKAELRKYTKVFTIGHINKEKIACEIELFRGLGVTREKRSPQIIVSLTSHPDRIYDIHYCLYSLLNQNFKPDRLILWLSKEEFPNLEEDLPSNILNLKKHGLEIKWTEKNFRSYDKLIHSLKEYPSDIIVTADDDLYYPNDWLERLYENYDGKNIVAHRAHLITFESGSPKPYRRWKQLTENDDITFLNFPTTGGGVLYPPNVFYKDVLKDDLFLKLSPNSDDIWFWAMLVLNDKRVKVIKNGYKRLIYVNPERELNLNDDGTLFKTNVPTGNDESISALLEYYPEIKDKLLIEIGFDNFKSKDYWENRYKHGNNSGAGSYGFLADFKASIINDFVKSYDVETVIEFGCGDGNQLKLSNYKEYIGFDVSKTAVEMCRKIFKEDKTKSFYLLEEYDNQKADLTLSLDVIYHLIEDNVFEEYMERLFSASDRYVIIYSSNSDEMEDKAKHVKHRKFTDWVEKNLTNWKLINVIKNKYPFNGNFKESSFSDFYFYEKDKL